MFIEEIVRNKVEHFIERYKAGERHGKDPWDFTLHSWNKDGVLVMTTLEIKDVIVEFIANSNNTGRKLATLLLQLLFTIRATEFETMEDNCPYSNGVMPCRDMNKYSENKKSEASVSGILSRLISAADRKSDGHLTIFKFTTNWKGCLGSPNIRDGEGSNGIQDWPAFDSFDELALSLLEEYK